MNFKNYVHIHESVKPYDNFFTLLKSDEYFNSAYNLCVEIETKVPNSEAMIVGGAVRDVLMGKTPHDIDVATNAPMSEITRLFKTHDIGKSKDFGIVVVLYNGHSFEVANYRQDVGSSDHRRPDSVNLIKTFEGDSARRDFTINSLAFNTKGEIVDYQNGLEDLKKNMIRTVGDPKQRFIEDYIRILRGLRFAIKFNYKIEDETKKHMKEMAEMLLKLSPERIKEELFKVASISGPALANYIRLLDDIGALQVLYPEVKGMQGFQHNYEHHPEGGVWDHTLKVVERTGSNDPITNLASLFHDIGKPATYVYQDDKHTYHGHADTGKDIFDQLATRLKFSNEEKDAIKFAIEHHMQFHHQDVSKKTMVNLRQSPHWNVLKGVYQADVRGRNKEGDEEGLQAMLAQIEQVYKTFGEKQAFEKKMGALINGHMIMDIAKTLNHPIEDRTIGVIKTKIRDFIVSKDFNVTGEEISKMLNDLILAS